MNSLINDNFLLETNAARELYNEFAKELPIVDYHCHIDSLCPYSAQGEEEYSYDWRDYASR